jgi:hypothetical protein
MNITLTITLAPEVLTLVESFVSGFTGKAKTDAPAADAKETPVRNIKSAKAAADKPDADEGSEDAGKAKVVTLEQVRALANRQIQAGKRNEVSGLLKEFGAASMSALDKKHYADFFKKVEAL